VCCLRSDLTAASLIVWKIKMAHSSG
jgi:hypothetical protein